MSADEAEEEDTKVGAETLRGGTGDSRLVHSHAMHVNSKETEGSAAEDKKTGKEGERQHALADGQTDLADLI